MRRLAKAAAVLNGCTYALYKNPDGTYGFDPQEECRQKDIIEYISKY